MTEARKSAGRIPPHDRDARLDTDLEAELAAMSGAGIDIAPNETRHPPVPLLGWKNDQDKIRMELIPPELLTAVGTVLTIGAKKYGDRNWEKGIGNGRVYGALLRHLNAWWAGEAHDLESGYSHLWHAGCCIAFLIAYEARGLGGGPGGGKYREGDVMARSGRKRKSGKRSGPSRRLRSEEPVAARKAIVQAQRVKDLVARGAGGELAGSELGKAFLLDRIKRYHLEAGFQFQRAYVAYAALTGLPPINPQAVAYDAMAGATLRQDAPQAKIDKVRLEWAGIVAAFKDASPAMWRELEAVALENRPLQDGRQLRDALDVAAEYWHLD